MTLAMSRSTADSNLLYSFAQLRDPRNQPTENSRLLVGSLGTFGLTQLNLLNPQPFAPQPFTSQPFASQPFASQPSTLNPQPFASQFSTRTIRGQSQGNPMPNPSGGLYTGNLESVPEIHKVLLLFLNGCQTMTSR